MADDRGPAFYTITNRQVYEKLEHLEDKLDVMQRDVDAAARRMAELEVQFTAQNRELTERVRALELRFYGILAGLIAAAASIYAGIRFAGGG